LDDEVMHGMDRDGAERKGRRVDDIVVCYWCEQGRVAKWWVLHCREIEGVERVYQRQTSRESTLGVDREAIDKIWVRRSLNSQVPSSVRSP
jgi:hypothetical protein